MSIAQMKVLLYYLPGVLTAGGKEENVKHFFPSVILKGSCWNVCCCFFFFFNRCGIIILFFDVEEIHLNKAEALQLPQRSHRMILTCRNNMKRSGTLAALHNFEITAKRFKDRWDVFSFFFLVARKPRSEVDVFSPSYVIVLLLSSFSPSLILSRPLSVVCISSFLSCVHDTFM